MHIEEKLNHTNVVVLGTAWYAAHAANITFVIFYIYMLIEELLYNNYVVDFSY